MCVTNPLTCVTLQWTVRWMARVGMSLCYTAWLVVLCGTVFHMCYHTTAAVGRVCAGAGRRTVATSCSCHMAPNLTTLRLRHDIAISSAQSIPTAFHSNNGRHVCYMYGMEYRLNSKQRGHRRQGLMLLSNPTEHWALKDDPEAANWEGHEDLSSTSRFLMTGRRSRLPGFMQRA